MRKTIIRSLSILGIFFVLFAALIAVVRFYPYTYNFPAYPKITHTQSGAAGDPINMLFVGSKNQIMPSFQKAGWLIPDPITSQTSAKIVVDSLAHRSYPTAPVSNLSVFGRVQDLAFEKPTNDVQNRGHIRIWKTGTLINGQPAWVGAASYDSGIELSSTNHFPTHHIAPTVDLERNAVGSDLEKTDLVKEEVDGTFTPPILYARNGGGDYYASDSRKEIRPWSGNSQMAWAATHVPVQLYLHPKRLTNTITLPCHPERSEGSRCPSREIMSAAKDDRGCAPLQPRSGQPLRDS